jgi:hypothetical protein
MPSTTRREFLAGSVAVAATAFTRTAGAAAADTPTLTWSRTYTTETGSGALVRDIVPTGYGFAMVGVERGIEYRGWVRAVDEGGGSRWERVLGTEYSAFFSGTRGDEGVLVTGSTNGRPGFEDPQYADPYVVNLRGGAGATEWARTYQPDALDGSATVIVPSSQGYVVAGNTKTSGVERPWATNISRHGTSSWEWTRVADDRAGDVNAATPIGDGVALAGAEWPAGVDDYGRSEVAWIAKFGPDGTPDWRRSIDGEKGDRVEALVGDGRGGVVALGRRGFAGNDRGVGWLTSLDADGEQRWSRTYPQDGWNWHHDVAAVEDGYLLLGTREGSNETDRGAWLTRVSDEGRVDWEYQAPAGTRGYAVRPIDDGGILVAGDKHLEDQNIDGGWLAKLGGDPAPPGDGGNGFELPRVPSWLAPFTAGAGLGALATGVAARLREP